MNLDDVTVETAAMAVEDRRSEEIALNAADDLIVVSGLNAAIEETAAIDRFRNLRTHRHSENLGDLERTNSRKEHPATSVDDLVAKSSDSEIMVALTDVNDLIVLTVVLANERNAGKVVKKEWTRIALKSDMLIK